VAKATTDRSVVGSASHLTDLRLLHLADSALPIGALAHSFGLETLAAEGLLVAGNLQMFLQGWLAEVGILEAIFCRESLRLSGASTEDISGERWLELNHMLSARKTARESRIGSLTLGRNFLSTVMAIDELPALGNLLSLPEMDQREPELRRGAAHYCLAFGLVAGLLGFDERRTVLTFLHQSIAGMVSGCQRLLPLGQTEAARILWNLKPLVVDTAELSAAYGCDDVFSFVPLLDWGAMEHPALSTRLFVS
jgi:urease accessory protein